jgi:hypothetical protein
MHKYPAKNAPWDKQLKELDLSLEKLRVDKQQLCQEFAAAKEAIYKVAAAFKDGEAALWDNKTWSITTVVRHDYLDYDNKRCNRRVLICDDVIFDPAAKFARDKCLLYEAGQSVRYETTIGSQSALAHADLELYVNVINSLPTIVEALRKKHYQTVFKENSSPIIGPARRENPLQDKSRRV